MRDWDADGPLSVVCSLKSVSCCLMRKPRTSPSVSGCVCVCVRVCVRVCVSQWWCVLPQNGNRKNSLEVYWDSSPDMSLLTLPSLNTLTHTHTHTHTGTWLISSPFTANTFLGTEWRHTDQSSQGFPWKSSYTHTDAVFLGKGLDFTKSDFFFCFVLARIQKNIDFNSKKKWSTVRRGCFEQIANSAPPGRHFVHISWCLVWRKVLFFFLKFRLFYWSLRVTETKTLQETFKKQQHFRV